MTKPKAIWLVGLLVMLMVPVQATVEGPVWFWFATCGGPRMTLEVRFDKSTLHKSSFPLCRADRASVHSQGQDGYIKFTFTPHRRILWEGYTETNDRSAANQPLEFDIWQAGADPKWLTIGVSVMARDRILMNTVHIAHPDRRDKSSIARGLVVATYPSHR